MGSRVSEIKRYQIRVEGIVQGVGFRPFIYGLAIQSCYSGYVLNDVEGVLLEIQGQDIDIENFCQCIKTKAPKASYITNISYQEIDVICDDKEFIIQKSPQGLTKETLISPDLAICEDCKREIKDKNNRRYQYAFTNCTNCGPRFSIVQDIPYDRQNTTMKVFPMCKKCEDEYTNPLDRRFHAQPNACDICGPQYKLVADKVYIANESIKKAHELIKKGAIVAVKGIGGYHLVCDAFNEEAVANLRQRKIREDKPFAVMATNLDIVKKICEVNDKEEELLTSMQAPIVLLHKAKAYNLASKVAPHNAYLGVMIAYAPIHYLLLNDDDVFVMTSANLSDEPIVYQDEEAKSHLSTIADYILSHNRIIQTRVDDSVVRVFNDKQMLIRRSRGYAPSPVLLKGDLISDIPVLACGPELKNTFCMTKGQKAFLSQHIGDLENMAVNNAYKNSIDLFKRLFTIKPKLIACDMHPEYFSTKFAKSYAQDNDLPLIQVQHHHAHIASVMAEHDLKGDVIGVSLDGTGFGDDGHIWGGEFFIANLSRYERRGHFQYMPLPSGAKAVKEPWRLGLWIAYNLYGEDIKDKYPELLKVNWQLLIKATQKGFNAPFTSSAGRIFDTVASLLGICYQINYEGQAAIELEKIAYDSDGEVLPFTINKELGQYIIDFMPMYQLLYDLKQKYSVAYIAKSFHLTMAKAICEMIDLLGKESNLNKVVLSGGVCQNITLLDLIYKELQDRYDIYINEKVPSNDGGIALGQMAVALTRYLQENDIEIVK